MVIAIIAILASMLLPALSKAREKARAISCTNNQKHIGTAILMYTHDNNDYSPFSRPAVDNGWVMWYDSLRQYWGYGTKDNPKIIQCPARNNYVKVGDSLPAGSPHASHNAVHRFRSNYAFHTWISGVDTGTGYDGKNNYTHNVNLNQMKRVSESAVLTDVKGIAIAEAVQLPILYTWDTAWQDGMPVGRIDPRHGGRVNVVFFDGHVQSAKCTPRVSPSPYIWDLPQHAGIWPYHPLNKR